MLRNWLGCESCIDTFGHIFPSKIAIDIVHFYFVRSKRFIKYIESAKCDNQGGLVITFTQENNISRFVLHVMFDGIVDFYQTDVKGETKKERLILINNMKGFGTDKYQF